MQPHMSSLSLAWLISQLMSILKLVLRYVIISESCSSFVIEPCHLPPSLYTDCNRARCHDPRTCHPSMCPMLNLQFFDGDLISFCFFSFSLCVAPQGEFLGRMGLVERLHQLAANLTSEDEVKDLIQSTEKVATGSMGNKFKFLSISHPSIKPPGFS